MKYHDLAESPGGALVAKRTPRKKPEPYYPSVPVRNAKELERHPVGRKLTFKGQGMIESHRTENSRDGGTNSTTTIRLHSIGVQGQGQQVEASSWCPKCGAYGKGPFCKTCGERMRASKSKAKQTKPKGDVESEEDYDD